MKVALYHKGQIYTLEQIKPVTQKLKFILSRSSHHGRFFLYKQNDNQHLWVSGPFAGAETNLFLYVGYQNLKKGLTSSFSSVIRQNLETDWKHFKETHGRAFSNDVHTDTMTIRAWASDFFRFENKAFKEYFD